MYFLYNYKILFRSSNKICIMWPCFIFWLQLIGLFLRTNFLDDISTIYNSSQYCGKWILLKSDKLKWDGLRENWCYRKAILLSYNHFPDHWCLGKPNTHPELTNEIATCRKGQWICVILQIIMVAGWRKVHAFLHSQHPLKFCTHHVILLCSGRDRSRFSEKELILYYKAENQLTQGNQLI